MGLAELDGIGGRRTTPWEAGPDAGPRGGGASEAAIDVSAETWLGEGGDGGADPGGDADRGVGAVADVDPDPEAAEADTLLALGDEIATLAAHIHAATHRLLTLVAEFDRRRGWERAGFRSCAPPGTAAARRPAGAGPRRARGDRRPRGDRPPR